MAARLFVALPLPPAMAEAFARYAAAQRVPDARWLPAENLHVTVHFLGPVEREEIEALTAALAGPCEAAEPFALRIADARPGPPRGAARMVWAALEVSEPFAALVGALAAAAAPFAPRAASVRPGRPHVTLARLRRPRPARTVELDPLPLAGVPLAVERCVLFESSLSSRGARYSALVELPLGAS